MVGDVLRKEREKQGMTIADIEKGTSIRALYIECIERGNIEGLPGMVYAKGFVRNYASFLRLDAEKLMQQFAEEQGTPIAPPPPAEEKPHRVTLSSVGDESLSKISIGGNGSSSYAGIFGKLAVGIIVLVALVGGGAALVSYINTPARETAQVPSEKTTVAAPAAEADAADEARSAAAQDVRVSIHLSERCWTEVQVDGETVYEGLLEEGVTENWQGKDSIVVRAGNAGAVEVTANGKKLGKFGAVGEVVERRFTKTTKDLKDTVSMPAPRPSAEAENTPQPVRSPTDASKDTKNMR